MCGAGNNGGDGIAAARLLFLKGLKVRAFLVGDYEKLTPDALEETRCLSECGVELERFDPADESQRAWVLGCDVVIDALFGVGLSRPIGAGTPFAAAVDWMNESRAAVVAADIASGVSADTGAVLGRAVRADRTVTFTLPKIGQAVGEGAALSGNVEVRDIGIPADLVRGLVCRAQTVERDFARAALPPRRADGHKGTFGRVLIIGGAVGYTGLMADVRAAGNEGSGTVYIPAKCVLSDGGSDYVYVVSGDGSAVKTSVTQGRKKNAYVEITEGLAEGSEVVLQSSRNLDDGMKVRVLTVK